MTHWAFWSPAAQRPLSRDLSLKTHTESNQAVPKTSDSIVNEQLSENPGCLSEGKCPFSESLQEEFEHRAQRCEGDYELSLTRRKRIQYGRLIALPFKLIT